MATRLPPVAILIAHRVSDWATWRDEFDAHALARKQAGCLGHHVNRGVDDSNMVYVYCPATDVDAITAFIDSADLPDVMKKAGVEGAPTVTFMKPMSADFIPDRKLAGIIVKHSVEDYDRWRTAYDAFDAHRRKVGIVGHAVNLDMHQENHIVVYHQAEDVATLRAFVDSSELKDTMKRAGVVGAPDVQFVVVAGWDDY